MKSFTETLILWHFDLQYHIWIATDAFGYAIGEVLNQITGDQHSSDYVIHKNHSNFSWSKIDY